MTDEKDGDQEILIMNESKKSSNKSKQNLKSLDPLKVRNCELNNDVYTLYWIALNKESWEDLNSQDELKNVNLSLNSSNLKEMIMHFIIFSAALFFTLTLILYQVFTTEIDVICPTQITILRILLVFLCQCNLTGEFRESLTKMKYTVDYPEKFSHPFFAVLICIIQFIVALASYSALLLFICTEIAPLDMIMDFTGIVVFVQLDDWIGDKICCTEPDLDEEKIKYYGAEKIDKEMSLFMKLSLLQYSTDIIEDNNKPFLSWTLSIFRQNKFVLYFLPLLVLVVERLFIAYHPYVAKPKF